MNTHPADPSRSAFRRWAEAMLAHRHQSRRIAGPLHRVAYQTSTLSALLDGIYDGDVTIAELLRHGDFGLGTFNHLDGELLILDGICHHLRSDGSATIARGDELTPFATVVTFHSDHTFHVHDTLTDRTTLTALIDAALDSLNLIYAIRITGEFATVHTRTVMKQHRPYPPLVEAADAQAETTLTSVRGTLAGFRMPEFEQGNAVAGYHLHFLDEERRHGGHALDYRIISARIDISVLTDLHLSLPRTPQFLNADLSGHDVDTEIRRSEGS